MPRRSRYHRESPFSLFAFQDIIAAVTGVMILMTMLLILELVTQVIGDPSAAHAQSADPAPNTNPPLKQLIEQRDALAQQVAAMSQQTAPEMVTPSQLADLAKDLAALEAQVQAQQEHVQATANQQRNTTEDAEAAKIQIDQLTQELKKTRQQTQAMQQRTPITLLDGDAPGKQPWFMLCSAAGITAAQVSDQRELTRVATFPLGQEDQLNAWIETRSPQRDVFVLLVKDDGVERFNALQRRLRQLRFDVGWDLASVRLAEILDPKAEALPQ